MRKLVICVLILISITMLRMYSVSPKYSKVSFSKSRFKNGN